MIRAAVGLALAGCLVAASGCKPTYRADGVQDAIVRICQQEYGVHVAVQVAGRTIGAFLPAEHLLQGDLTLSDRALDKVEHAMLTVSRVALSAETPYEFFVITVYEPETGIALSFVRYLKDIRRLITDDISRNDFFQRMLIDVSVLPIPPAGAGTMAPVFQQPEYTLPDFLARQIAERLRQDLELNFVERKLFKVTSVEGAFVTPAPSAGRKARGGTLRLSVLFHPDAPDFAAVGTPDLRNQFLRSFLRSAQTVTRRYDFTAFDGLEIADAAGRRLAWYDRAEFSKDAVNTLMDLIRSIKDKPP